MPTIPQVLVAAAALLAAHSVQAGMITASTGGSMLAENEIGARFNRVQHAFDGAGLQASNAFGGSGLLDQIGLSRDTHVAGLNDFIPGQEFPSRLTEDPPFPFTSSWYENQHRPEFPIGFPPAAFRLADGGPRGIGWFVRGNRELGRLPVIPGDGPPVNPGNGYPADPGHAADPSFAVIPNPEPASFVLFGIGACALAGCTRRRHRKNHPPLKS